eukprot:762286-Prymnesium_polylepis.1
MTCSRSSAGVCTLGDFPTLNTPHRTLQQAQAIKTVRQQTPHHRWIGWSAKRKSSSETSLAQKSSTDTHARPEPRREQTASGSIHMRLHLDHRDDRTRA